MRIDELISKAQSALNRKTVNGRLHGDVGAALISEKGDIYTGVCVDTSDGACALSAARSPR
jgi:cytidine deaminase